MFIYWLGRTETPAGQNGRNEQHVAHRQTRRPPYTGRSVYCATLVRRKHRPFSLQIFLFTNISYQYWYFPVHPQISLLKFSTFLFGDSIPLSFNYDQSLPLLISFHVPIRVESSYLFCFERISTTLGLFVFHLVTLHLSPPGPGYLQRFLEISQIQGRQYICFFFIESIVHVSRHTPYVYSYKFLPYLTILIGVKYLLGCLGGCVMSNKDGRTEIMTGQRWVKQHKRTPTKW